jgi:hypothetical protein
MSKIFKAKNWLEYLEVETNLYLDFILLTRSRNLRISVKIHSLLISKYVRYEEQKTRIILCCTWRNIDNRINLFYCLSFFFVDRFTFVRIIYQNSNKESLFSFKLHIYICIVTYNRSSYIIQVSVYVYRRVKQVWRYTDSVWNIHFLVSFSFSHVLSCLVCSTCHAKFTSVCSRWYVILQERVDTRLLCLW